MENCFSTDADHRESAHKQARQTAHDDLNPVGLDFWTNNYGPKNL